MTFFVDDDKTRYVFNTTIYNTVFCEVLDLYFVK